jgi:DNA invertase Pin-like site-specific DNA recombinase
MAEAPRIRTSLQPTRPVKDVIGRTSTELAIIRERTKAGMRAARARGSQIGPKKRPFDAERATRLRDQGWGQIRIARELGVGVGRVNKWVKEGYLPPERRTSR